MIQLLLILEALNAQSTTLNPGEFECIDAATFRQVSAPNAQPITQKRLSST